MAYRKSYRGKKSASKKTYSRSSRKSTKRAPSGAHISKIKQGKNEGQNCIVAWRKTSAGLLSMIATPFKGSKSYETKMGKIRHRWMITIKNKSAGTESTFPCFVDDSYNCTVPEMGICINPSKGYVSFLKR